MKGFAVVLGMIGAVNAFDGWKVLPPKQDWRAILKSFDKPEDVDAYIKIYIDPFKQLQAAARNNKVSPDTMKTSMVSLFDLVQKACRNFNISSETFSKRKREDFREILDGATKVFNEPDADHLEPVFKKKTIHHFVFQRLDDMLVSAKDQKDLLKRVRSFHDLAKKYRDEAKKRSPKEFKFIIRRNLDWNVIGQYSGSVIKNRLEKGLKGDELNTMQWKLHSLGNFATVVSLSKVATFLVVLLSAVFIA